MPKTDENEEDYLLNENPICPYCDHICYVSEDFENPDLYEEGEHEKDCPSCNETFGVYTNIRCSYDTYKKEEIK